MTKKPEHIHKYSRVKSTNGNIVYRCMLPGCTHYVPKYLVKGRISLCHVCKEPMIMDSFAMRRVNPRHVTCIKKSDTFKKLQDALEKVGL